MIYLTQAVIHTNHYIDHDFGERTPSTIVRFERAREILLNTKKGDVDALKSVLADKEGKDWPICLSYKYNKWLGTESVTVCSIVMNVRTKEMHITRGSPNSTKYEIIPLI